MAQILRDSDGTLIGRGPTSKPMLVTVVDDQGAPALAANDLRGLHANRPAATAVVAGTTYWSVDEPSGPGTVFVSDGATWSTLVVL